MLSKRIVVIIVSLSLFLLFILFTNPQEVSLAVILVPFILLGIVFYNLLTLLIERFLKKGQRTKKLRLFGLVGTLILVNFTLLSSIGQFTFQDTILAILITIVGGFYLYKFQIN